jgi:uncharacterized protein (TIGR03067 family)
VVKAMVLQRLTRVVAVAAVVVAFALVAGAALASRLPDPPPDPPTPAAPAPAVPLPFPVVKHVDPPAQTPKSMIPLDGTWRMISVKVGGKDLFQGLENLYTIEIAKDQMVWKVQGATQYTSVIKVDPSKKPAWLDLTFTSGPVAGKTLLGIYEIKDGILTITQGSENGDRPEVIGALKAITRSYKRESP